MPISVLFTIACIPMFAGGYLLLSNENIGFDWADPFSSENYKAYQARVRENIFRYHACRDIVGEQLPEEKSACMEKEMNHGDMFIGDLVVAIRASHHAITTQDKVLAKKLMAFMDRMEVNRHYDDINFDIEKGRALGMMTDSILSFPIKLFLDGDLPVLDKNTFVEPKMDMLKETRTWLREAFDL